MQRLKNWFNDYKYKYFTKKELNDYCYVQCFYCKTYNNIKINETDLNKLKSYDCYKCSKYIEKKITYYDIYKS